MSSTDIALILLVVSLGTLAWTMRGDVAEYAEFKSYDETTLRQRRYRYWIAKSFLLFCVTTIVCLAILGKLRDFATMPSEFSEVAQSIGAAIPKDLPGPSFFTGIAVGLGGVLVALTISNKRSTKTSKALTLGDIAPLMPRNAAETVHTAVLSINAGLSEELFFRLLLPLLFTLVFGNAIVAFACAAVVFGLAHIYQGWAGVLGTAIVGFVLTVVYLATKDIWIAVAVHACIDVFGIVVRPTVERLWRRGAIRT
jgi:membrane protease YdiL (CAAX protease family)